MSTIGLSKSEVKDMLRGYFYANAITYSGGMLTITGVKANKSDQKQLKHARGLKKLVAKLENNREKARLENELIRKQVEQIMQEMRSELKL